MPSKDFVAFLRGISNVPMRPFRDALSSIGLEDVVSYGGTGNLLFRAEADTDCAELRRRVEDAVRVEAFIRSRSEMATLVAKDPFAGQHGASVFLSHGPFDRDRISAFLGDGFAGEAPVVSGAEIYFMHPLRRPGRKGTIDLERELEVRGTMRASRVLARVFELM